MNWENTALKSIKFYSTSKCIKTELTETETDRDRDWPRLETNRDRDWPRLTETRDWPRPRLTETDRDSRLTETEIRDWPRPTETEIRDWPRPTETEIRDWPRPTETEKFGLGTCLGVRVWVAVRDEGENLQWASASVRVMVRTLSGISLSEDCKVESWSFNASVEAKVSIEETASFEFRSARNVLDIHRVSPLHAVVRGAPGLLVAKTSCS